MDSLVNNISRPQKKYIHGQMLISVLIATAIFAIFSHALFTLISASYSLVSMNKARVTAKFLAQEKIEFIRNLDYSDVGTIGGIPSGIIEQEETVNRNSLSYNIKTTVLYVDDDYDLTGSEDFFTDYKRVSVQISWEGLGGSDKNPLIIVTDISDKTLTSIAGKGTLSISVTNAFGVPVADAIITIKADSLGINSSYETATDGTLIIPGSEPCTECYQISVTKSGYSTDRTYSTLEVTNPFKPYATVIENNLTQIGFVIDKTSTLNVNTRQSRESGFLAQSNVSFILRGNKSIGNDAYGQPVYKYQESHTSDGSGVSQISNLEWDVYTITMPEVTSYDIAGSNPLIPISILPDSEKSIDIALNTHSTNSLLSIVKNTSQGLIPQAVVKIQKGASTIETTSGAETYPDFGQVFFPGLDIDTYNIEATASGYLKYTGSMDIDGNDRLDIILSTE